MVEGDAGNYLRFLFVLIDFGPTVGTAGQEREGKGREGKGRKGKERNGNEREEKKREGK